jgi:hypothetical protein
MNDQPPFPKDTLELLPPPPPRSSLAKLAIILATTAGICFGLCTVTLATDVTFISYVRVASIIVEALCIVGLIIIGLIVFVRSFYKNLIEPFRNRRE